MTSDLKALITLSDPNSPVSEAYRALRTNLAFASIDTPLRTLMFTSPGAEEGKSTILANLAVTIAQTERRVLVVDSDLRRPCQHELFGLPNEAGLTTLLVDLAATEKPPFQETPVPGLQLLASGPLPPRPADLIGSRRMEEVVAWLTSQADVVLFDSPPINAVTDAAVLATRVDGVILVVRERHTRREAVVEAQDRLARVKAHVLGAILNGVSPDRSFAHYYGQGGRKAVQGGRQAVQRAQAPAPARASAGSEAGAGAAGS
jgi:non-specific protein-tyrosine kinase